MQLITSLKSNFSWKIILFLLVISGIGIFSSAYSQDLSSRPRKVGEKKIHPAKSKPRPLIVGPREIREAKETLTRLGYWLTQADDSYRQSLIAFQKIEGLKPTGKLKYLDLEILRNAHTPAPREAQRLPDGKIRIEVDLGRQVLFLIDSENKVMRILTISSGNGKEFKSEGFIRDAVTPPGRFTVYNKIKGWKKSPLGLLYYPNYYLSGLAIHGSQFVPAYPDSHGCIRIPMFAAVEFYQMAEIGTEVLVYNSKIDEGANSGASQFK